MAVSLQELRELEADARHARFYNANLHVHTPATPWDWTTHTFPQYASRDSDILIQGETNLDEIGIRLGGRIIETPGHTIDSISVLLEDGSCFVGDAAANFPQFIGTKYCVIQVEDIEEYYKSWRTLISGGAQRIFPAHGKPFAVTKLRQNIGKIKRSDIILFA